METKRKGLLIGGTLTLVVALAAGIHFFTTQTLAMPDLDRPFNPSSAHPQDIQDEARQKVATAVADLKSDPSLISRWLEIAVYRKNAGDFEGAEEIWIYVTKRWPDDLVAYNNLADLYQNYTRDYEKAEANLIAAIGINPQYIPAYRNLHELYALKLEDEQKAADILRQGLEVNPQELDLLIPLAIYLRDGGHTEEARSVFTEARVEARRQGKTELADIIDVEISKLR